MFTEFPDTTSLREECTIWAERHASNYFLGFSEEQLANIPRQCRPKTLVDLDLYEHISNTTKLMNKNLTFVLENHHQPCCSDFIKKLEQPREGALKGIREAQLAACNL